MSSDEPVARESSKSGSRHVIIPAIATVLAAVIGAAGLIIANTRRAKDDLEDRVVVLQKELDARTQEARSLAASIAALQKQLEGMRRQAKLPTDTAGTAGDPVEDPEPSPRRQVIDDFAVTITKVYRSGNVLTFDFSVVNNAPADRHLNLFGAGSFGNGNSRFIADGQEYAATEVRVGNTTRDGIVGKKLPGGAPLKGYVQFAGVPQTLKTVELLELAYSYNNLSPNGAFRYTDLPVD